MTAAAPDWLCRSALFVPADDERKLEAAARAGADALVYDLEDAVAPAHKKRARELVCAALRAGGGLRLVRVNGLDTPWGAQDVGAVAAAGADGVMLPKCESAAQLDAVAGLLDGSAARLIALIETPAGVFDLPTITAAGGGRLAALGFGHADFCRAAGLPELRADTGLGWHARCQIVLAAKARDLLALDCVCLTLRDEDAFRADATLGRELGYDGKLCVHPAQVPLANALYTPSAAAVAQAQRVLAAWQEAQAAGRVVVAVDGLMVDAPVAAAHRRTLERARRAGVAD